MCLTWLRKLVHLRMMSTSNIDVGVLTTLIVDIRNDVMLHLSPITSQLLRLLVKPLGTAKEGVCTSLLGKDSG